MEVTSRSRLQFRLQNSTFNLLLVIALGLLAWLSTRYYYQADWTANSRHTLSQASVETLEQLKAPLDIAAYAGPQAELRSSIRNFVERYQRHKHNISLVFTDPASAPGEVRELGIQRNGELVLNYQGQREHLTALEESAMTQVLQRLLRVQEHWLVFLAGHGERDPMGQANHDLGEWGKQVKNRGLQVQSFDFAGASKIPDNTSVLVLAGAQTDLGEGEAQEVLDYINAGGNLLWLLDPEPGSLRGLESVAKRLGVTVQPGTLLDPLSSRLFGYQHRSAVLVTEYGQHPVTEKMELRTLFPESAGLVVKTGGEWEVTKLFGSHEKVWSETGELTGTIEYNAGADVAGPLDLAFALNREIKPGDAGKTKQQRIIVVGDGDFLSNAYLQNSGNLELGMNMVNWLAGEDNLLEIPAKIPSDLNLELSKAASIFISFGFLFVLPLLLLASGFMIWWRRRKI